MTGPDVRWTRFMFPFEATKVSPAITIPWFYTGSLLVTIRFYHGRTSASYTGVSDLKGPTVVYMDA
jgi:hypothetical protein